MRRIKLPFGLELRSFSTEEQGTLKRWEQILHTAFAGRGSATGRRVTPEIAMAASAINAGVSLKSSVFASLPLIPYRRLEGGGRERATDHWSYWRLTDEPNPEMTAFELKELLYAWRMLWGEAFFDAATDMARSDGHIWPLHPALMDVRRPSRGAKLEYWYTDPFTGVAHQLDPERVHHIKGLSLDGVRGGSQWKWMQEAIGLALATEEFSARFFGQGGHLGGVISYDGELAEGAREKLKKAMADRSGLDPAHQLMLLEYGLKYEATSAKPNDSQMIEARKFQVTEVARFLGLPPHLLGDLERATFSNIEEQDLEFLKYFMRPDLVRFASRISRAVFTEAERRRRAYYCEFLVDSILQADVAKRSQYYKDMWGIGVMTQNQICERENLNPVPNGDERYVPLNMVPVSMYKQVVEPKARSLPAPERREAVTVAPAVFRSRLTVAYRTIFVDACARIVRREVNDLRRAADKMLKRGDRDGFRAFVEEYYRGEDFTGYVARQLLPVVSSVSDQVVPSCAEEAGSTEDVTERILTFCGEFASTAADRWAGASRRQIEALMDEARSAGAGESRADDEEDAAYAAVSERLTGWEDTRADKEGDRHAVESVNAIARMALMFFGVMRLVSVAVGASTCPYCMEMDGRVVGIKEPFLKDGDSINAAGHTPLISDGPKYHPPYHRGCDCQVQATF